MRSAKAMARSVWQQVVPFPYSLGPRVAKHYMDLRDSQWYTRQQHVELQHRLLHRLIRHAYENVPYYQRVFDERGIRPSDIQCADDLKQLPVLGKDGIRKHFEELLARNHVQFKPALRHTSGSTGEPLHYYIDRELSALIGAVVARHWQWCGVKPTDRIAVFRGTLIDDFGGSRPNYVRRENNQLHFSTFRMNAEMMRDYVQELNRFRPTLIRGYPGSLAILARFLEESSVECCRPKAVHTSSEVVLPEQRELIERVLGAPLFDWYGHGESTVCAGECEAHGGLHLNLEFGITEFLQTEEYTGDDQDDVFRIVSTSLWNYSMPLLRYETEDLALFRDSECSCGREMPVIEKIIGRQADIIRSASGISIAPSSFVHFWKYKVADQLHGIGYAQIVQETEERIRVKLVGSQRLDNEDVIKKWIGILLGITNVVFEYLPEIPAGEKWRFTVSHVLDGRDRTGTHG